MQRDCELGIKECSLRMRDEKRRVIEREKERVWGSWFDVQKSLMCGTREAKEDRRGRERKIQVGHNESAPVCVYDRGKTRLR